jgi:poly(A) polymerase
MEAEGPTPEHDSPEPRVVPASAILPSDVDQDALRVLSRLQRNGFEAYLVGGCVRDLLLGRKPKDFDVATAAHPRQIRRLFRNARIIGRRFRLVHIVYGEHVIETSTFRSGPPGGQNGDEDDLLIVEDNVFGNAEQDARRRDFTINGLFYDPSAGTIHDWVAGLSDLERGIVRTIGDPTVRMQEDPVRILRAIKFATRLGFRIDERTWQAMGDTAPDLLRCAPPRVFEEILRLLRSGTALGALRMMRACGALSVLLPSIDAYLGRRDDPDPRAHDRADLYWRLLEALDADVHAGAQPTPAVCLAVLFLRLVERAAEADPSSADWGELAERELDAVAGPARLPRKAVDLTKRILSVQRRFTQASTQGYQPLLFLRSAEFPEALDLFRLRSAAWGQGWDVYEGWLERYRRALEVPDGELQHARALGPRRRRRRRRRGRRGRGAELPAGPASDRGAVSD